MSRLYALLIGGSAFHDDKLNSFWKERIDVERFNALFNIRTKSLKEIHLFQSWLDSNELDIRKFAGLRNSFDYEKTEVQKLNKFFLAIPITFILIVIWAVQPLLFLTTNDSAIIKLKAESDWVALNGNSVSNVSFSVVLKERNKWHFEKADCQQQTRAELADLTSLTSDSIDILCKSFTSKEDAKFIQETLQQQRSFWYAAILLLVMMIVFLQELIWMVRTMLARTYLDTKLKEKQISEEQQ